MPAASLSRAVALSVSLSLSLLAASSFAQSDKGGAAPAPAAAPAAAPAPAPAPAAAPAPAPAPAAAPAASGDAMSGIAAVYGRKFAGRKTASGARYNPNAMTAAHNTLPFGTRVKVTAVKSKRSAVVTINDRGPTTPGRIIDLSSAAARKIGMVKPGLRQVTLEVVSQPKARAKK